MKFLIVVLINLILTIAMAAENKGVELDENDLAKKNLGNSAALLDEQPLKVQENLVPPARNVNLLQIQNQVLNLNLTDKEIEQSDSQIEE